jgi:cytidylate kinase
MFRVLTIAREFGSGGATIAQKVAEKLKWNLLDKALIDRIARAAQVDTETAQQCDERVDSWVHRISRRGLWRGAFDGVASVTDVEFFDAETMAALAKNVVAEAGAAGNCVIVGRGAQCTLHNCPDALHVFVYAPWAKRAARVRARMGNAAEVDELIRTTDQTRASYIRTYFGSDWKNPHLYHMMVSSLLGDDNVAQTIIDVIQRGE